MKKRRKRRRKGKGAGREEGGRGENTRGEEESVSWFLDFNVPSTSHGQLRTKEEEEEESRF